MDLSLKELDIIKRSLEFENPSNTKVEDRVSTLNKVRNEILKRKKVLIAVFLGQVKSIKY
jgi:Mg-chelatase subunit ChlI